MKKYLLAVALFAAFTGFAQEENPEARAAERKHEIRLDAIELIADAKLELNYEYVLSKYSGVGGSIAIDLDDEDFDNQQKFAINGFYRQYFFNKKDFGARGLFAEGLVQYATYELTESFFNEETQNSRFEKDNYGAVGVGFALGQKWVSNNGFILELSLGVGRNFGVDDQFEQEYFFRGGVLVGYRFL